MLWGNLSNTMVGILKLTVVGLSSLQYNFAFVELYLKVFRIAVGGIFNRYSGLPG